MSLAVLREALALVEAGRRLGLATIVGTRGATPQKVGARLLVADGSRILGTLGGGAIEADAVTAAWAAAAAGAVEVRDYAMASATDEWGLACGGAMTVLLEPVGPGEHRWLRELVDAVDAGEAVSLVTALDGPEAGVHVLVRARGSRAPAAGAGLAGAAREIGQRALAQAAVEILAVEGTRVYAEPFAPPPALVVLGAGHVGRALARLGRFLDVRVTVVDDRPEYASRDRLPEADLVVAAPVAEAVGRLAVTPDTALVVAMRSHDLDYEATAAALRTAAGYVGLVGARRKAILVIERLVAEGLPVARARALRSPVGLDIGARTPEEIAVAILGEWIMTRHGGSGTPLRLAEDLFDKATRRGGAAAVTP